MQRRKLPGPACETCRIKSRRCDRARPACGRCVSKGLECGGYPDKYRFCGLASRGKWKNSQIPTTGNGPGVITNSLTSNERVAIGSNPDQGGNKQYSIIEPKLDGHENQSLNPLGNRAIKQLERTMSLQQNQQLSRATFQSTSLARVSPTNVETTFRSVVNRYLPISGNTPADFPGEYPLGKSFRVPLPETVCDALDERFDRGQANMLLTHYAAVICPHQIQQFPDEAMNPYKAFILPLSCQQLGLLYAVLGLAASHLGHLKSDRFLSENIAVEYRLMAIQSLSNAIRDGISRHLCAGERDAIFATIQILLLHDISDTGISEHGVHISGAVSICRQLLDTKSLSNKDERSIFFIGNLIWLDIVRAFAHPERICFPANVRETIIEFSDGKLEMVNGCPRELMLLMGEALDWEKAFSEWRVDRVERSRAIRAIIGKFYSWSCLEWQYPTADPLWLNVAEAFRHTCILRSRRLLDASQPAQDPEIQESVIAILDAASGIPGSSSLIELMVLPLFMAGADCLSPHSRHYIILRFAEIKSRSEMANPVPRELLQRVWEERAQQPDCDRKNVPWMEFTKGVGLAGEQYHDYLIL